MLGCPIKTSKQWIDLLEKHNGNEEKAYEEWYDPKNGYILNDEINYIPEELEALKPEDRKDDISKMVDDIRVYLRKQLNALKKQKIVNQSYKEKKQENLIKEFEVLDGIDAITMFIKSTYEESQKIYKKMQAIINKVDDGTPDFKKNLIKELTAVNNFVNGYNILDEISKKDIYNYFSPDSNEVEEGDTKSIKKMLKDTIELRESVKQKYIQNGIPLMASFLLNYKSIGIDKQVEVEVEGLKKRLIAAKNSSKPNEKEIQRLSDRILKFQSFTLTQESMEDLLRFASEDEGLLDFWFNPLISSKDASLGLFAKVIKTELEGARMIDNRILDIAGKEFDKYRAAQSASRDNPAKFNEGIYEDIIVYKKNEKGRSEGVKRKAFVQKYDINKYEAAQRAAWRGPVLSENPTRQELLARADFDANKKTIMAAWYAKNAQKKSDEEINKIIAEKEQLKNSGVLTEKEYNDWYKSVLLIKKDGTKVYMKEFSEPSADYINPKWEALYDKNDKPKNAKGEYHQFLLKTYLDAQEKLPDAQKPGYILPSIHKQDKERRNIKEIVVDKFKDATSIRADDTRFGIADFSEGDKKFLPVYYTQEMDADEVSLDLVRSVVLFSQMANKYEALNRIEPEINLFKTIIGDREVAETNSKGVAKIDAFANKLGIKSFIKKQGESYSQKHVDAFIDMIVFNETEKAQELFGFSGTKITNMLMGYSALTSIAADLLKGTANNLQGNIQLIIEANSAEFFSRKDLRVGKLYYAKHLTGFLSDFGKTTPESLVGQLVRLYDPMQGNFKDQYGKNISPSAFAKLMRTDTLFFNQHFGEHEIQVSAMFALMNSTKVKDNNTGQEISLLDAYTKYGIADIENNTNFTNSQKIDLQNRIHAISKKLHGVYNEFDKGTAQRYAVGRLVLMYRKHLVPGYKRRWGTLKADQELGSAVEGYYITFYNTMLKDLAKMKFNIMKNWATYTPFEKAQIKRTLAEVAIIVGTSALIYLMTKMIAGDDDDDKNSYAYNFMLYEITRMNSETAAYLSPPDAYRTIKSPSAMVSSIERLNKFIGQFLLTWDPEKLSYQRREGVWEKGDNKSWAYFLKLIGFSGYNFSPEAAVKSFNATILK